MVAFHTRLKQTVTLVENRVKDKSSDDPLKDLVFLADHYSSKHEWDKANAATRHMLALAEGDSSSVFQTTPIDIELLQTTKRFSRERSLRMLSRLALACALLLGFWFAVDLAGQNPKFILDVKALVCAQDPMTFVDRADFFQKENKLNEALAECEKALALNSTNSEALQEKAFLLFCIGDYQNATRFNELSNHKTARFYSNQSIIQNAVGDNRAAATASEMENAINAKSVLLYSTAWSSASAGDYEKALRFAQLETLKSKTDYERAEGLSQEARYLLPLGRYSEAIRASSDSIGVSNKPLIGRAFTYRAEAKYHLSQYMEAVADASTAINIDCTDYRAYTIRAKCFEMMGRVSDAQADLHTAVTWRNGRDI